ncbi:unnamed protein product [Brassicogethes aeneus]|uniref:Uncharacterized protein n=1 Tax=Brassicogethes aeneus TaxID=1431903 RepID=A0A9P0AZU9_BRAAE|nr:unnamed protein product [Brassicogethes aeneus]
MNLLPGILVFNCLLISVFGQNSITSRLDKLDINYVLSTGRILDNYLKCIMDKGPCTVEGRELKGAIPEAIIRGCKKCSEPTKKIVKKSANYIIKNRPGVWTKLKKHFDPEEKYLEDFNKFLTS